MATLTAKFIIRLRACIVLLCLIFSLSTVTTEAKTEVLPLPGGLNDTPVFNSNCPEVVLGEGVLLSTFPGGKKMDSNTHLNYLFEGDFEVFLHHIANGEKSGHMEDLYIALIAHNPGKSPVKVMIKEGRTYLSQPDAPFIPLEKLQDNTGGDIYAGPGDRVATEILSGGAGQVQTQKTFSIKPRQTIVLDAWPIPVCDLKPPLNGRNALFRMRSEGKVALAAVALFAHKDSSGNEHGKRPDDNLFIKRCFSGGRVKPAGLTASKPGAPGPYRYGRVSGVSTGSKWQMKADSQPIEVKETELELSFPVATVKGGTFGTDQEQSAYLLRRYEETAYRAHGNYGVLYDITLPVVNRTARPLTISLRLDSPLKSDSSTGDLSYPDKVSTMTFFRGTLKHSIRILAPGEEKVKPLSTGQNHLVLHKGEKGDNLVSFDLDPGKIASIEVELIYPADSTPPQVITLDIDESKHSPEKTTE